MPLCPGVIRLNHSSNVLDTRPYLAALMCMVRMYLRDLLGWPLYPNMLPSTSQRLRGCVYLPLCLVLCSRTGILSTRRTGVGKSTVYRGRRARLSPLAVQKAWSGLDLSKHARVKYPTQPVRLCSMFTILSCETPPSLSR